MAHAGFMRGDRPLRDARGRLVKASKEHRTTVLYWADELIRMGKIEDAEDLANPRFGIRAGMPPLHPAFRDFLRL